MDIWSKYSEMSATKRRKTKCCCWNTTSSTTRFRQKCSAVCRTKTGRSRKRSWRNASICENTILPPSIHPAAQILTTRYIVKSCQTEIMKSEFTSPTFRISSNQETLLFIWNLVKKEIIGRVESISEGTALDEEAAQRGTSVYLADNRIDMVPILLSSNLCSLRGGEGKHSLFCSFIPLF